jgi:hypothetical protein
MMGRVSKIQAGRYNPPTDVPFYSQRVALERLYNQRRADRLMVEGCMRVESDGARGYLPHAPSTVGASEVRVSPRPRIRPNRDETGDMLRDSASLDRRGMGTYTRRVVPAWFASLLVSLDLDPATRTSILDRFPSTVVESPKRERQSKRTATTGTDAGASYLDRLAAFGADLSLIEG